MEGKGSRQILNIAESQTLADFRGGGVENYTEHDRT